MTLRAERYLHSLNVHLLELTFIEATALSYTDDQLMVIFPVIASFAIRPFENLLAKCFAIVD